MAALVSVIVPTYNRAARIGAAVQSVLRQTWRPLELVIVDDGSSDGTPGVLESLRPAIESAGVKAQLVRQPNAGAAAARNRGMREAVGEWLAFLDDDDSWAPEKTAAQMALATQAGASGCCGISLVALSDGSFDLVPERGQKLLEGACAAANLRGERHAHIASLLVARRAADQTGEFDSRLNVAEDLEWLARACHHVTWAAWPGVVHTYDRRAPQDALTGGIGHEAALANDECRAHMLQYVREKCEALPGWDAAAWRQRAGMEYRAFVRHAFKAGRYRLGVELYHRGMELSGGAEDLAQLKGRVFKARFKAMLERKH